MRTIVALLAMAAAAAAGGAAQAQTSVSIGINQPGVYGRIDIGDLPPPALVQAQPVIIAPAVVAVQRRPIYLYVPVEAQRHWGRYCGRYNACGQPVYFVRDEWVRQRYAEQHRGWERHDRGDHGHGHSQGKGRDDRRDDSHDDHHEDRHGDRH